MEDAELIRMRRSLARAKKTRAIYDVVIAAAEAMLAKLA